MKAYTDDMKALRKEINALKKQLLKMEESYEAMGNEYVATVGYEHKGVNIKRRKASYVITRSDGLAITTPLYPNKYGERMVFWYDGKKGDKALDGVRMGCRQLAEWLDQQ